MWQIKTNRNLSHCIDIHPEPTHAVLTPLFVSMPPSGRACATIGAWNFLGVVIVRLEGESPLCAR